MATKGHLLRSPFLTINPAPIQLVGLSVDSPKALNSLGPSIHVSWRPSSNTSDSGPLDNDGKPSLEQARYCYFTVIQHDTVRTKLEGKRYAWQVPRAMDSGIDSNGVDSERASIRRRLVPKTALSPPTERVFDRIRFYQAKSDARHGMPNRESRELHHLHRFETDTSVVRLLGWVQYIEFGA